MVNKKHAYPHLVLHLAYDGAAFGGFQWQKDRHTVQAQVEEAMAQFLNDSSCRVQFTSRTDAGVHAWDQLIIVKNFAAVYENFSSKKRLQLLHSLNFFAGPALRFWKAQWLREDFSPKEHIVSKTYRYQILCSPIEDPIERQRYFWVRRRLDPERMKKSLNFLQGEKDFAAFTKSSGKEAKKNKRGTRRRILQTRLRIKKHPRIDEAKSWEIDIEADGFLQHMVRNIVGSLVDEQMEKIKPLPQVLASRNRQMAGRTAPSGALFLLKTKLAPGFCRRYSDHRT